MVTIIIVVDLIFILIFVLNVTHIAHYAQVVVQILARNVPKTTFCSITHKYANLVAQLSQIVLNVNLMPAWNVLILIILMMVPAPLALISAQNAKALRNVLNVLMRIKFFFMMITCVKNVKFNIA